MHFLRIVGNVDRGIGRSAAATTNKKKRSQSFVSFCFRHIPGRKPEKKTGFSCLRFGILLFSVFFLTTFTYVSSVKFVPERVTVEQENVFL